MSHHTHPLPLLDVSAWPSSLPALALLIPSQGQKREVPSPSVGGDRPHEMVQHGTDVGMLIKDMIGVVRHHFIATVYEHYSHSHLQLSSHLEQ